MFADIFSVLWKGRVVMMLAVVMAAAGCVSSRRAPVADSLVSLPETYGGQMREGSPPAPWFEDLTTPRLSELLDEAFTENFELRAAWARLSRADAIARQASASFWPTIEGQVEARRSRHIDPLASPAEEPVTETRYRGSLAASYEVDVWGRLRHRARAADFDLRAAESEISAVAVSLAARIIDTWHEMAWRKAQLELLDEQIEASSEILELTRSRVAQGQAGAIDAEQQRQQMESLYGRRIEVESALATSRHLLAILLGRIPQDAPSGVDSMPEIPPVPDVGVPADLLIHRPDVRAAWLRLRSADERSAAEAADRLPRLRLSLSLFNTAASMSELLDRALGEAAAAVSHAFFTGGRRSAEMDAAEAGAAIRLMEYGEALLSALQDVADAMTAEDTQTALLSTLQEQLGAAENVLTMARERYVRGAGSYLRVLTALQECQRLQQRVLAAKRGRLAARLQLYRALGGSWTRRPPEPSSMRDES